MDVIDAVIECCKGQLTCAIKEGATCISQQAFFVKDNLIHGVAVLGNVREEDEKIAIMKSVGSICAQKGFDQVILAIDSIFRSPDGEYKTDALVLNYVDFRDADNFKSRVVPYEIKGTVVSFASIDLPEDASFGGLLIGSVIAGFFYVKLEEMYDENLTPDSAREKLFSTYLHNFRSHPELVQSLGWALS